MGQLKRNGNPIHNSGQNLRDAARGLVGEDGGWDIFPDGQCGLWRVVPSGVMYSRPQAVDELPFWSKVARSDLRYRMILREKPERIFTFAQFCEDLRREAHHLRTIPSTSPIVPESLQLLDRVVDKIIGLVDILHENNCGVGLLAPENILIFDWGSEITVIFSDLGFKWHDPWAPTTPRWLESNPSLNPYVALWEDPRDQLVEFDVARDLRILGRVFCSALLGQICRNVPDVDVCPETKADAKDFPGARRVWIVIRDIIEGELKTLDSVREALALYPLSQHFLGAGRSKSKKWMFVLGAATYLVFVGLALYVIFPPNGPPPKGPEGGPPVPQPNGPENGPKNGDPPKKGSYDDFLSDYKKILGELKDSKNLGDFIDIKAGLINLRRELDQRGNDDESQKINELKSDIDDLLKYEFYDEKA